MAKKGPVPILFSVPDVKTQKPILQMSYERKWSGTFQFRNDVSKIDREKKAKLYDELNVSRAQSEADLVVRGNSNSSKNG